MVSILIALALYYGWRYSKTTADPDWALFNLSGFTGAYYGYDYFDCKMPGIHLWYWMIAKIVGKSVERVKFMHTVLVSVPGIILYYMTGSFWIGLAFIVMINTGWLITFHGNVGQVPAGLMAISIASHDAGLSIFLWLGALLFESKVIAFLIPFFIINGWLVELTALFGIAGLIALQIRVLRKEWWELLWEMNITIPKLMRDARRHITFGDSYCASGFLYVMPWICVAVIYNHNPMYWAPVLCYLALLFIGYAIRPNHLIPIIPWVVLAGTPPELLLALSVSDFVSGFGYWSDLWKRFYPALHNINYEAKEIGLYLKGLTGTLWVNSLSTSIYIYAQKKPIHGFVEQVEMRDVVPERRRKWVEAWKTEPPDYVVEAFNKGYRFNPAAGYKVIARDTGTSVIYKKED